MTGPQRRALEVLWEHGPMGRNEFEQRMWPTTVREWRNASGAAGRLLKRLSKAGWAIVGGQIGWHKTVGLWAISEFGGHALRRERILEKIA